MRRTTQLPTEATDHGDPIRGLRNGLLIAIPLWLFVFGLVALKGCP